MTTDCRRNCAGHYARSVQNARDLRDLPSFATGLRRRCGASPCASTSNILRARRNIDTFVQNSEYSTSAIADLSGITAAIA
jgi:hypothetical protein